MNITNFKSNLGLTEIPSELEKLINFQNDLSGFECYSQGFGVLIDDKSGLATWSEDSAFLDRLLPFAQANGSGSFYTFWNDGTDKPLNQMPIVVFGDEGGVHVVAENLLQLLHQLTYDTEISVDFDSVYFYKDEDDYEESEYLPDFLQWLKTEFDLDPVQNPDDLIEKAKEKYQDQFNLWAGQYYDVE